MIYVVSRLIIASEDTNISNSVGVMLDTVHLFTRTMTVVLLGGLDPDAYLMSIECNQPACTVALFLTVSALHVARTASLCGHAANPSACAYCRPVPLSPPISPQTKQIL